MTDDIFVNEDLSKPENRINVALFGLLGHDWLRSWLLSELDLPAEAVIYPSKNQEEVRPDFKIALNCTTLAWVEVEVGTDPAQVVRYRESLSEPVVAIWGRKSDGADLSLEEIAEFMSKRCTASPNLTSQVLIQVRHLLLLIKQALEGRSPSYSRVSISDEMLNHPLVNGLRYRLGNKLLLEEEEELREGFLKADATDSEQCRGFSLQMHCPKAKKKKSLSLLAISGGRPRVQFPTELKLREYLPAHGPQIDAYVTLIRRCGLELSINSMTKRPSLHYECLLNYLDELAECLLALADRPSPS